MMVDDKDPENKRMVEKRIHREEYEGQDLWRGQSWPLPLSSVASDRH
jgi:hypothetical protein